MNNLVKVIVLSTALLPASLNKPLNFDVNIELENIKNSVFKLLNDTKKLAIEEFSWEGLDRKKDTINSMTESIIATVDKSWIKDIITKETNESYKEKIKKYKNEIIQKLVENKSIKYNFCKWKNRSFYYDPLTNEQGIISFSSYMVDRNWDMEVNDIYKENGWKIELKNFDSRRKYITKQYHVAIIDLIKSDCVTSNSNSLHERRKKLISEDRYTSNF